MVWVANCFLMILMILMSFVWSLIQREVDWVSNFDFWSCVFE